MARWKVDISYRQIVVFSPELKDPLCEWAPEHLAQGFTWEPGYVAFTSIDDGRVDLDVQMGSCEPRESAQHVIRVPFELRQGWRLKVGGLFMNHVVWLKHGQYALTFEHGDSDDGSRWCTLWFERVESPVEPSIIKGPMAGATALVMEAEPAGGPDE